MIDPITTCACGGRCQQCLTTQLPAGPMPPLMGAPHERATTTAAPPAADQNPFQVPTQTQPQAAVDVAPEPDPIPGPVFNTLVGATPATTPEEAAPAATWTYPMLLADGTTVMVPITTPMTTTTAQPAEQEHEATAEPITVDAGPTAEPIGHDAQRAPVQ